MPKKSYDLQLMVSISRGNNELVQKLIRLFLRNTPGLLSQLEMAYKGGELHRFKELVNEIRPSFGYFCIREVEADLEMAERLAHINFTDKSMGDLIKRIMLNANAVIAELAADLQQFGIQPDKNNHCATTELPHYSAADR